MSVAPKRPKGPPLNAMRAFEAAARHSSFVAAAEELNVTPGAISQHIKTLEGWARAPLFRRHAQGVALTREGRSILPEFSLAFDRLADAARALRDLKPKPDFHIAALPAIAQLWLPSRLRRIRAQLPDLNFSVTALEAPPSLSRELFDLSIFFSIPEGTADHIPLCTDEIAPVCAPDLLPDAQGSAGFSDMVLLHDQVWKDDWDIWSSATGVRLHAHMDGPRFSLFSLAVEEAKAGAGLLMGHLCLLEDVLASGALVRAHPQTCDTGRTLSVVAPAPSHRRPETDRVISLLAD